MKASINRDTCIGCGLCASFCPAVFALDDENIAAVIEQPGEEHEDGVREAAEYCPVAAIIVE